MYFHCFTPLFHTHTHKISRLVGIPGQVYRYGALQNYTSFFISGFPGGVSYFNLVLVKLGVMSKLKQKKIDKYMNVWCRCPGLVIAGLCHWLSFVRFVRAWC